MSDIPGASLASPTPPFRDRRMGIRIFGSLTLAMGAFLLLAATVTTATSLIARSAGHPTLPYSLMAPCAEGALAAISITLGIASLRLRRWSRPLTLCLVWGLLFCGGYLLILLPSQLGHPMAARASDPRYGALQPTLLWGVAGVYAVHFVGLPALYAWYYGQTDVRSTLDTEDPWPCWTDRIPVPVLLMFLWLCFDALVMAGSLFLPNGVVLLGHTVRGGWWILYGVAWTAAAVVSAWGVLSLRRWAWTAVLVLTLLGAVNSGFDLAHPARSALSRGTSALMYGYREVVILGFLLWVRRYFGQGVRLQNLP